jgi:hypothetical protein
MTVPRSINFRFVADAATAHSEAILRQWLPDGRREAAEWIARNSKRGDRRAGSFKINLRTGRWGDFATGDKGGDLISLAAYLFDLDQRQAALKIADMMGVSAYV